MCPVSTTRAALVASSARFAVEFTEKSVMSAKEQRSLRHVGRVVFTLAKPVTRAMKGSSLSIGADGFYHSLLSQAGVQKYQRALGPVGRLTGGKRSFMLLEHTLHACPRCVDGGMMIFLAVSLPR